MKVNKRTYCPICGEIGELNVVKMADTMSDTLIGYECAACDSIYYHPINTVRNPDGYFLEFKNYGIEN